MVKRYKNQGYQNNYTKKRRKGKEKKIESKFPELQKIILKSEKEYDIKEERLLILLKERKIKLNLNNNGYSNDINNSTKILYRKNKKVNKPDFNKILIHLKNILLIMELLIFFNFIQLLPGNKFYPIALNFSKITLKIKGAGNKNILGAENNDKQLHFDRRYYPNEIYINGKLKNIINYSYTLNQNDNYIELIWNNSINNCRNMFRNCKDITEIDFSEFDTSFVTDMFCIFFGCSSLTSLNLTNFVIDNTTDISGMFQGCSSLTSLNLSHFKTSKVKWMNSMFRGCSSLTSVDISNFDTSQVTHMDYMIAGTL